MEHKNKAGVNQGIGRRATSAVAHQIEKDTGFEPCETYMQSLMLQSDELAIMGQFTIGMTYTNVTSPYCCIFLPNLSGNRSNRLLDGAHRGVSYCRQ